MSLSSPPISLSHLRGSVLLAGEILGSPSASLLLGRPVLSSLLGSLRLGSPEEAFDQEEEVEGEKQEGDHDGEGGVPRSTHPNIGKKSGNSGYHISVNLHSTSTRVKRRAVDNFQTT